MPKGENVEFFANIELNTCLDQRKQIFISPVGINQVSAVQLSIYLGALSKRHKRYIPNISFG